MKTRQILMFLLASLFLFTDAVWAQTSVTVSGVVSDEHGETLPGVSILEVGTTSNGTLSDVDGHYVIEVKSAQATLQFSYVGYKTQTISLKNRTMIDVTMKEESKVLDEVVVVGYGVQKKVNLTGSVAAINFSEQMEGRPVMNVSSALSGLAAGMNVRQGSGQPGSDGATIRIRGNGTFNTNSPLVLVDGIEWSMDNVNPNDIESISVLKDAASTAIYGTRAANGVILITTKTGKGKPQITYSYSGVVQNPYNELGFVSDYAHYMSLVNEACENVGTKSIFSQESIDSWKAAQTNPDGLNEYGVPNYVAYPNTDWFDEIFSRGYSQEHNLSVSGGSEKVKYMLSLGYLDNKGVMNRWNLDSSTQKINFRTNLEADITKWLKVGTRLYGQKQDYGMANISNGFKYLYQTTPGVYPGEPNYWGRAALAGEESSNANNIFGQMAGATGFNSVWRVNASLYGTITPYKGLSIEATVNYSPTFRDKSSYSRQNGYWDYVTDQRVSESALANASITNTSERSYRQGVEILARYNTTINKDHDLGALLGYSAQKYYSKSFAISRKGATDWTLNEIGTYEELVSSSSSSPAKWGLLSYFGRVNYAYKSKYLFEANLRADASSRFGQNQRWGYFPSFSAGWRIAEENFMKATQDYLSNLKLRVSWGKTGNNSTGNYDWQANYAVQNVVVDGAGTKGLVKTKLSNDKLHWESTTTTDIGLDFGFFNNRLTGEFDFYEKSTSDILYHPALYLSMGKIGSAPENLGKVRNRGLEFTLNWNSRIGKDFEYKVGMNIAFNKNKVTKFKGNLQQYWTYDEQGNKVAFVNNFSDVAEQFSGDGYICEGKQLGETYQYNVYRGTGEGYTGGAVDIYAGPQDGMIRTPEDLKWVQAMIDSGYTFGGMKTVSRDQLWYGDLLYDDLNGDMNYGDSNDRKFSGHTNTPKVNLGINLAMSYKDIDFSMQWAGAFGHYIFWNTDYYNSTLVSHGYGISQRIADDHYFFNPEKPEDVRTNVYGKYPRLTYGTTYNNRIVSDWYEYKGDYLKLKNIQLGYTLPQSITKKIFVSRLRAFVSMDNILTITKYPGLDPEIGSSIGYPLMRQISFGGQITF